MDSSESPSAQSPSLASESKINDICDRFEDALKAGKSLEIEDLLQGDPTPNQPTLLRELLAIELAYRRKAKELPSRDEYVHRFPHAMDVIEELIPAPSDPAGSLSSRSTIHHPSDGSPSSGVSGADATHGATIRGSAPETGSREPTGRPEAIGKYKIKDLIGEGAFGRVYRGYDPDLQRQVAIKVPRTGARARPLDVDAYLREARVVARLEHPGIVPVFEVGWADKAEWAEGRACFVVSKYIEGDDLKKIIDRDRLKYTRTADIIAQVAEALSFAHRQGLVHRDIKPANILIDEDQRAYVADFGLAWDERDYGRKEFGLAGTPLYMSPEQARSEGHRVDGRSDIFSLGVVFYELLTGRPPFRGDNIHQVMDQIKEKDATPPRQRDETIPQQLDDICMKALSKKISERYENAQDMASELRGFLEQHLDSAGPGSAFHRGSDVGGLSSTRITNIIPKGLRSFDADDKEFFLQLLPGPRGGDGLPDSIRFWKKWVEQSDSENDIPVGILHGPSGCGKSSLVKAGLLPRLPNHVDSVYLEATAEDTESRLLRALHRKHADLSEVPRLSLTIAQIRMQREPPDGKKTLIVLDQFEQWLHGNPHGDGGELAMGLRQCAVERVQCLLLVRDDYVGRAQSFVRALDLAVDMNKNSREVSKMPAKHARKVLAAFGQAYESLPTDESTFSREEHSFLDQAVSELASDGPINCAHLALFTEMVKDDPWLPKTLRAKGGIEGIRVNYLEQTFSEKAEYRRHQRAARNVLAALLPEGDADIKGSQRPKGELLEISGYSQRPEAFRELLQVLDSETRLITPTDSDLDAGRGDDRREPTGDIADHTCYYQLTHDFLVKPIREWLHRKQRETLRGRAGLRFSDLARSWNASPESRHLPSWWWEYPCIRLLVPKHEWTESQRRMMKEATKHHGRLIGAATLILAVGLAFALVWRHRQQARRSVDQVFQVELIQVPQAVEKLEHFASLANGYLDESLPRRAKDEVTRLRYDMAKLPFEPGRAGSLVDRMLGPNGDDAITEFRVLREYLHPHRAEINHRLWTTLSDPDFQSRSPSVLNPRFLAACALARYEGDSDQWPDHAEFLADELISHVWHNQGQFEFWLQSLRPIRQHLLPSILNVMRDVKRREIERDLATRVIAEYAADDPQVLVNAIQYADEYKFAMLFSRLNPDANHSPARGHPATEHLRQALAHVDAGGSADVPTESPAWRRASLAVALYRVGEPDEVWRGLIHQPNPEIRAHLIHMLALRDATPQPLIDRCAVETDVSARRAILLALSEFSDAQLAQDQRAQFTLDLLDLYRDDPDPGVHGAAEFVLRQWGQEDRVEDIDLSLATGRPEAGRRWYINRQMQTMVILDAGDFAMGSPQNEPDRNATLERRHQRHIGRTFAMASKEVTRAQFDVFLQETGASLKFNDRYGPQMDGPQVSVTYYLATQFCNWLSEKEGIPRDQWCYEPNLAGEYAEGMNTRWDYLTLTGYRLPTEAEWEYACRAGAVTSRFFGHTDTHLNQFAWCNVNSPPHANPVGALKPNDFGLFDMLGNVFEWTDGLHLKYPTGDLVVDTQQSDSTRENDVRILRGGSWNSPPSRLRSAFRYHYVISERNGVNGFRVARTQPARETP